MHVLDVHSIRILSMRIGCTSKSAHISNWTSELNQYIMGHVSIVSRSFMPSFHRCTMETIKLCVSLHQYSLDAHVQSPLSEPWQGATGADEGIDHRMGKGSQSLPWFLHQSNQQPFCCHFQLREHIWTTHLYITSLLPRYNEGVPITWLPHIRYEK